MLGRGVHPSSDSFRFLEPFIKSADLGLANLESPLASAPARSSSPYMLCASPAHVKYLAASGLDLLSLENNHQYDCGTKGASETRAALAAEGLGYLDERGQRRTTNGVLLAFLAIDATGEFDLRRTLQAVDAAHETGALVVISIHWGAEYQSGPSAQQRGLASQLAQAGASLIWGHHPHVLQPAEWINSGRTLVFYSLGNALFDQQGLAGTRQSALALVRLDQSGVIDFQAIPIVIDVPRSRIVKPEPADERIIMQYFPSPLRP
jgi:poly-gamma-glutamate synthesis protein (capsule biosynthesis protein)